MPKKRGPKRGHGRVINELRAQETKVAREPASASASASASEYVPPPREPCRRAELAASIDTDAFQSAATSAATSAAPSPPAQPFIPWTVVASDPRNAAEPQSPFTCDAFRPNQPNYLCLVPCCVDLYYEHIYPIMPLVHIPTVRATIRRPMASSEKNLVYALCALTAFHMAGKSLSEPGNPSWDRVGRFFLDECISVRQSYDFLDDTSLQAVTSSFWLSTSFFEINQSRKSWYYLREALTLAIDLRLHDDATYAGLSQQDKLCRQRVFWILFVTERSFAILRNKPLTLRKTPSLPTTKHSYEAPEIHAGFLKLVSSYVPLDESFVNAWNDGSDPRVSATTYLNLQHILAQPLDFLRRKSPSPPAGLPSSSVETTSADDEEPSPTDIQKADLLMTQQWLRLIVWQSSFRQGLLSTAAPHESFAFAFPLTIARDTAAILQSLPSKAVEVHGMGIFEKIFEIGTWCVNVLGAYDSNSASPSMRPFGGAMDGPVAGNMDFVGGELGLFGPSGRACAVLDPLEFFVKTLSASPNSKTMYADKLLMFAGETPGGMRTSLSPALSLAPFPRGSVGGSSSSSSGGLLIGHVEERDGEEEAAATYPLEADGAMVNSHSTNLDARLCVLNHGAHPDLALDLTATRTRGSVYSISDGPLSAGFSTAFSELSSSADYGLSTGPMHNDGPRSSISLGDSPFAAEPLYTNEGAHGIERAAGAHGSGDRSADRLMGTW